MANAEESQLAKTENEFQQIIESISITNQSLMTGVKQNNLSEVLND
jgi:hypothetical protein